MSERTEELIRIYRKFGQDVKRLLSEYPKLECMEAFSDRGEGILEWFPFCAGASMLQIGAGDGVLSDLFLRKGLSLTVFDREESALRLVALRAEKSGTADFQTAKIDENSIQGSFDYIFINHASLGDAGKWISFAKAHLKKEGTLFFAADNAYGIRSFAGAKTGEHAISKEQADALFQTEGNLFRYYAEPMRTLPSVIYSDAYLPKEGELSRVIPAYGFPAYLAINPGEKYDAACRDGLFPGFADAFLYVWRREGKGPDTIFVKYNRNRRAEYQIKTEICVTESGYQVQKSALKAEGVRHIREFEKRFFVLHAEKSSIRYARPQISKDGFTARFPFVEGMSLTERIRKEIRDGKEIKTVLEEALRRVIGSNEVHNLDSIFDNFLIETGDAETDAPIAELSLTGIDYEWVTDAPADVSFVKYRILLSFYEQQKKALSLGEKEVFLGMFDMGETEISRCEKMEREFQAMVSGDEQAIFLDRFTVQVRKAEEIQKTERALSVATERLCGFRAELREKDAVIRKQTEIKRLTDNHVNNLEAMIADLRRENGAMAETLHYLSRHQTLYARLRRRAGDAFRSKYPKGSKERKKLMYRKDAILHPIRHRKMLSTAEGRNLVEGDFAIGDSYRIHGKLHFETPENPVVSIIIPCYNQLSYTYDCLVSILEHTKGIPYEVIIADDVSTDETKNLSHFAEGIVIMRNTVNQGFLKNCNQAANKARGQYIFFLNNDTVVTDGWLSWLLKLMEADPTIGMAGSKLVYPDGRLQEAGGIIFRDASGWNYGRLSDPTLPEFNYVKDVDYISGAAILIRRALFEEIGGFDERYAPAYCEDSDLAFEVRKHGYRVVYQPKSVVVHFEGISNGTDVEGSGLKHYQIENTKKLREKWRDTLKEQFENTGNPDPFRARERSAGKKIILVVDHYVPTFDRDAGSRTTWQYLQMFVKQGFQVKFLGDNFSATEPYTSALQQLGIEVLYGEKMQAEIWQWIERHAKDLHLVYLNRPHIASKYIDFIQSRTNLKVLYYGHDLHFLREKREYALTGSIEKKESSEYWKGIEFSLMHKADMSFYPSEEECKEIRCTDASVHVKALTAYLWESFPEEEESNYEEKEGLLFVGGFSHPPNADAVLWFLDEIWPNITKQKKMNFYVAGSNAPDEILSRNNPEQGIYILGYVSDEELIKYYRRCRLSVAPLRYGAGVKGKIIEALYHGLPVLTTSVGAEGIPDADCIMRIEDSAERFAELIKALYDDIPEQKRMRDAARTYIKTHHSMEAAWEVIREDFS